MDAKRHVPGGLHLENISKTFGAVTALQATSLDIETGVLVSLLGPSGCGKTTTLRIIAGFEAPDTGRVLLADRDVTGLPPNKRRLGMVFQNYSLFPHMTVGANIAFGLKMANVARDKIRSQVRDVLGLVRLSGFEDRYVHQLSGGQQQRVALGRSLVTNPSLLLLDEPLGALDKNLRESMQFELRRIQQQLGITTLLVTHDQEEALTMSDRVAVMNRGRILQYGTPDDVYHRPRTRFVSEFLGTSNLFNGRVLGPAEQGYWRLSIKDVNGADLTTLRAVIDPAPAAGDPLLLAIRPEKMHIGPAPPAGFDALQAEIVDHVFRGSYHAYQVRVAGLVNALFVYQTALHADNDGVFDQGVRISVSWHPNSVLILEEDVE